VTKNPASKGAIRRRMAATGEKYTDARRAVLAGRTTDDGSPESAAVADSAQRDQALTPLVDALFADLTRTDPQPQRSAESTYQFLDRVEDPAFAQVRELFNDWFARFAAHQDGPAVADLRGRLRAKQGLQFYAAFWELYLHELFSRLGYRVEVHPEGPRPTRPDFVLSRDNKRFYLEAVVPAPSEGAAFGPAGGAAVAEFVDAAYDADFFVALRFMEGRALPRKRAVVAAVEQWLGELDWSRYRDGARILPPLPETELEVGGWTIGLQAIPRSPAKRGDRNFPTVGFYPGFGGVVESAVSAVVPTLDEKTVKYGELDAPYVIAAWVMSPLATSPSLASALFGRRVPLDAGRHAMDRPPSDHHGGIWTPDRSRRDRPSAVLFAGSWEFNYNAVARVMPRLWHNPWTTAPLPHELPLPATRVDPDETSVNNSDALVDPAELFELASGWPGTPFEGLESYEP
jgi:hypothetical protein